MDNYSESKLNDEVPDPPHSSVRSSLLQSRNTSQPSITSVFGALLWMNPVTKICSCNGRTIFVNEESETVVSKYTTVPPTVRTAPPLDVYQQIAHNIAERITSPLYRFLGYDTNTTTTPKPTWQHLELVDETPEEVTKADVKPVDNEIGTGKDVEELSVEALKKTDQNKPEKVTLYSNYLPVRMNDKANEIDANSTNLLPDDDEFDFDEFEDTDNRAPSSGIVYFLELVRSILTLAWGAVMAYFHPNTS